MLEDANRSAQRLNILVRDLLNVSRIETGRLKLQPKPTDAVELMKDVISEQTPQLKEKQLDLTVSWDKVPPVRIDPLLIRQVMSNLLSNAVKYTPKGGKIRVTIQKQPAGIRCAVQDTGIGIPKEDQKRLFENFFRASNAAKYTADGTGLGLSLAKSLVHLSGGKIGFTSDVTSGSEFWFTLPLSGSDARDGDVSFGF